MDPARFTRVDAATWRVEPSRTMRVPVIIYADENLIQDMDDKVLEQAANVARLPGIVQASYVMPDAHWGYGFPIGGVAAFDPDRGGVISAGGVGFDISCGVRTMLTGFKAATSFRYRSSSPIHCFARSRPASAARVRSRWTRPRWRPCSRRAPIGRWRAAGARRATSNGSRNRAGWSAPGPIACRTAPRNASAGKWELPRRVRSAINCALANREILGHYVRRVFGHFFPDNDLSLLFDVSHNTCKVERHLVDGKRRDLFVHRKGATRAFGPGHESLPVALRVVGQPVLIGGNMGTGSNVLVGETTSETKAFSSACHGAGRALSRHAALKQWSGRKIVDDLASQGILIRSPSTRGVAEEAPGAYKDVGAVVAAAEHAGLARRVARLRPLICIKG